MQEPYLPELVITPAAYFIFTYFSGEALQIAILRSYHLMATSTFGKGSPALGTHSLKSALERLTTTSAFFSGYLFFVGTHL
jgi:hypothetical protein